MKLDVSYRTADGKVCETMLAELAKLYDWYVDAYRDSSGELPKMMRLKRIHTGFVVKNAETIADGEKFDAKTREAAVAAALLHDTGRYEQLKIFNTFRDSESVDHAVFSHDIVKDKGWLDGLFDAPTRDAILKAVLYHNRREIPDGLDPLVETCSRTVRDADKLDIFRVLEDQVANTDWRGDSRAFWNLRMDAAPNPVVVDCIEKGLPVDYQNIQSLADFVLIQVGWMLSGLNYATSRRICRERGHLEFRRDFLHQLTDDPSIDRLCDLVCSTNS